MRPAPRACSSVVPCTCWAASRIATEPRQTISLPRSCSSAAPLISSTPERTRSISSTTCEAARACSRTAVTMPRIRVPDSREARVISLQALARFGREVDAARHAGGTLLDRADRVGTLFLHRADLRADLLRAGQHPVGEILDLVRHHREGPALLARLRRDDRRVERQQVRLVRHVVDHVDDGADLVGPAAEPADHALGRLGRLADRVHAFDGLHHLRLAALGVLHHGGREPCRLLRRRVHLAHRGRHLAHRGGGLDRGLRERFRVLEHLLHRAHHLLDRARHLVRRAGRQDSMGGIVQLLPLRPPSRGSSCCDSSTEASPAPGPNPRRRPPAGCSPSIELRRLARRPTPCSAAHLRHRHFGDRRRSGWRSASTPIGRTRRLRVTMLPHVRWVAIDSKLARQRAPSSSSDGRSAFRDADRRSRRCAPPADAYLARWLPLRSASQAVTESPGRPRCTSKQQHSKDTTVRSTRQLGRRAGVPVGDVDDPDGPAVRRAPARPGYVRRIEAGDHLPTPTHSPRTSDPAPRRSRASRRHRPSDLLERVRVSNTPPGHRATPSCAS